MKRSVIRSVILTGGAMVGITTTVTSGAASAWGSADSATSIDMSSGPVTASTPQPQTAVQTSNQSQQHNTQPVTAATTSATTTKKNSHKSNVVKKTTKTKSTSTKPKASAAPSSNTNSGTQDGVFTGSSTPAGRYGYVQVRIQVTSGSVTAIDVLQAPSGRSQQFTDYAVPTLINEAMNSQSASIATVGGASFTSRAFKSSLQSALAKAGL